MALIDNALSYFKLQESSGSRNDEAGSNDLTDNNTTGSATGIIGDGANFIRANSEYLSIASASQSPDLSINGSGGDIFISAWINMASKPAEAMYIVSKYAFSNGNREYGLYWDNTVDRFKFIVFNSTTGSNTVTASTFGAPSTSTWYLIMVWVDNTANTVNISVNDGTVDSTALTITTHNGTARFNISGAGNATPIEYFDGVIDEVYLRSSVPTSGERTQLYNGGAGLTYPFTVTSTFTPRVVMY